MGALSMLPKENKRVILGCKMVKKNCGFLLGSLFNVQCTVCSAAVNQDLNEPSGPHIVSNCLVYRWRDILIGYLVWDVRSVAKHGQAV